VGIGNGLIIDSFIPSLLLKTNRIDEITAYNRGITLTIVLLIIAITIILCKNKLFRHAIKK